MQHTITFRVRYPEVDAMGYAHHSRIVQYFEMGRIELLRSLGVAYADLEQQGIFFVVTRIEVRYRMPARYDDELTLTTTVQRQTLVRYDHTYLLKRASSVIAEGATTIACVGRDGQPRQIPSELGKPSAAPPAP
jgi:acyl-CoA thioester hydrolase